MLRRLRRRVLLGGASATVIAVLSVGCSGLLGFDDFSVAPTTSTPEGGGTDGGATDVATTDADPAFACANLPPPNPDPSKQVELSMRYVDFSTGKPPLLTIARLCANTDPNCLNARSITGAAPADAGPEAGTGWVVPTAEGVVNATVEYGFEGFFEAKSSLYPPTYKGTSPPLRNPKTEIDQLLLRAGEINFLADQLLSKTDAYESKGHALVFLFARDCNNQPLSGVSFTTTATDPLLQLFYVINTSPSIQDTKTDALGRAGYLNVPPGIHTFTGFIGEGDKKRKYGSGRILVRAGSSTTLTVTPSP